MNDEGPAPYEKAIEETAKATNNAIDLAREGGRAISPAIGNIYGLLIGDRLSAARERRLDEITRETRMILHDRDVKEQQEIPETIAIPLLEAAQCEPRKEMQRLWARLLANSIDPARANDVLPDFIETIKGMQPIDVLTFKVVSLRTNAEPMTKDTVIDAINQKAPGELRASAVSLSLSRLQKLGCLSTTGTGRVESREYYLGDYGHELLIALKP